VNRRTSSYNSEFDSYLSFDGSLEKISAYDAAKKLAYDTTFDADGDLTSVWMDQNYDWINPTFKNRVGESLNLAVNYLAAVLHTLSFDAAQTADDQRMSYIEGLVVITMVVFAAMVLTAVYLPKVRKK